MSASAGTSIRSAGAFILLIASKKPPGVITAIRWTSSEVIEPRVGFPAGKKHAFSGCHLEDFTVGIHLHLTRKNVKKLVFSRVDMGRWFSAPSHLTDNEVKRSAIIRGPRHLASKNTLVPGRIA